MTISALLSHADGSDEAVDVARLGRSVREDELLWVDVAAPGADELAALRQAFDLSDAAVAALAEDPQGLRARVLEDAVEVVVIAVDPEGDDDPGPLQVLLGPRWVITRHAGRIGFLADHRSRIQDGREIGRLSSAQFLAEVLGWQLDSFLLAADAIEQQIDRLDDVALRTEKDLLDGVVRVRRRIAQLRRLLAPHRDVYAELARPDFLPARHADAADELGQLGVRLGQALDALVSAREMLVGTFDIHMTRMAQRTNDTMRILTLASVVLLPAVVVAGVMGMNFKVAIFDNPSLFWVVIGLMVAMAAGTLAFARLRGWL